MDASVTFCGRPTQVIEGFWSQNVSIAVFIAVNSCKLNRLVKLLGLDRKYFGDLVCVLQQQFLVSRAVLLCL
jgi:hypothetical protein